MRLRKSEVSRKQHYGMKEPFSTITVEIRRLHSLNPAGWGQNLESNPLRSLTTLHKQINKTRKHFAILSAGNDQIGVTYHLGELILGLKSPGESANGHE